MTARANGLIDAIYWQLDADTPVPCDTCAERAQCRSECPLYARYVSGGGCAEQNRRYLRDLTARDGRVHLDVSSRRIHRAAADIGCPAAVDDIIDAYRLRYHKRMGPPVVLEHLRSLAAAGVVEQQPDGLWRVIQAPAWEPFLQPATTNPED